MPDREREAMNKVPCDCKRSDCICGSHYPQEQKPKLKPLPTREEIRKKCLDPQGNAHVGTSWEFSAYNFCIAWYAAPAYARVDELEKQIAVLEKKLAIAVEGLNKYAKGEGYCARIFAQEALKEIEGVK
jgi:hypothetical protein